MGRDKRTPGSSNLQHPPCAALSSNGLCADCPLLQTTHLLSHSMPPSSPVYQPASQLPAYASRAARTSTSAVAACARDALAPLCECVLYFVSNPSRLLPLMSYLMYRSATFFNGNSLCNLSNWACAHPACPLPRTCTPARSPEACAMLDNTPELDYLTHVVFRMYENKAVPVTAPGKQQSTLRVRLCVCVFMDVCACLLFGCVMRASACALACFLVGKLVRVLCGEGKHVPSHTLVAQPLTHLRPSPPTSLAMYLQCVQRASCAAQPLTRAHTPTCTAHVQRAFCAAQPFTRAHTPACNACTHSVCTVRPASCTRSHACLQCAHTHTHSACLAQPGLSSMSSRMPACNAHTHTHTARVSRSPASQACPRACLPACNAHIERFRVEILFSPGAVGDPFKVAAERSRAASLSTKLSFEPASSTHTHAAGGGAGGRGRGADAAVSFGGYGGWKCHARGEILCA